MKTRIALFAAAALVAALPALAQTAPRPAAAPAPLTPTEMLNQQSLDRARAGQNVLTGGPDTTQNLNAISERAAQGGRNMNQAPMPFR